MSRTLTKKQRGFVNDVADGVPGVQAALRHYDTEDYSTAGNIASENLDKPKIIEALSELGFDSNNAKRVVGQILNNEFAEEKDRLKAASLVFDVNGDLAPLKTVNVNVATSPSERIQVLAKLLKEANNVVNVERK